MAPAGRLTLTPGTPVTTADVIGARQIAYSPMEGATVPIFDGTSFRPVTFVSGATDVNGLALALDADSGDAGYHAANQNFYLFVGVNAGSPVLCSGPHGPGDQDPGIGAGSTALALIFGWQTNGYAMTCRYGAAGSNATFVCPAHRCTLVGGFRTTGAGMTEDSHARRFLWNAYHQASRSLWAIETAQPAWVYNTPAWRISAGDPTNKVQYFEGLVGQDTDAVAVSGAVNDAAGLTSAFVGIGVDSVLTNINFQGGIIAVGNSGTLAIMGAAFYRGHPGIGHHYLAWLEYGAAIGNTTWMGTDSGIRHSPGISATVWN